MQHQDSQTVARRPDRPQRLGQEHVCPQAFLADRGAVVGLLAGAGQRRRERSGGDERRLRRAALHRRQAAGAGTADGHRCDQRAARGAQAAGRTGPAVSLPAGRHRAQSARASSARSATVARRPRVRPARRFASSSRSCGGHCAASKREGFRHVFVLETPEEVEAATIERVPLWNDQRARTWPVRHHRRRPRLLRRTGRLAATTRLRSSRRCAGRCPSGRWSGYAHPERPQGGLRRRSGRSWAARSRHGAARAQHGRSRHGAVRARQPRHEAAAEAARQGRADHARPGRDAGRDRRACRTRCREPVLQRRWPSSSTAWSAITCSTTASWSSLTPA